MHVIDWETHGAQIDADLSAGDGRIHLATPAAAEFYANLIISTIDNPNG